MKLQSLNLCPYSDKWGRFEKLKSSIECKGSDFSMPAWFEVVAQPSCLVILRSRLVILRSIPAVSASGSGAGACACSGCGRCCGLPTPGANAAACRCRLAQAEWVGSLCPFAFHTSCMSIGCFFIGWLLKMLLFFQSSKENRPQKMPARPLEAKIVFVEQNSRLTLGSPSNNVKKSFVRWASHCVVCGPPVETERPARALKKKDVKKVQPVWLQVEQKREPVWLLLTFVNSFWLNSLLNSFPNSFWKFCTILTLLFLVPLYLCGHLCGGPPGPAVVPVLCHGFRG